MKKQTNSPMDAVSNIESYLEELVAKFPKMSEKLGEIIVSIAPWLTILSLIMLVPAILAIFGMGDFFGPLTMMSGVSYGYSIVISSIGSIVTFILYAMALSGLFKRQNSAWTKMFWAYLVSLIVNLLNFELGNLIIGGLVGAYVLFSVKKYYK